MVVWILVLLGLTVIVSTWHVVSNAVDLFSGDGPGKALFNLLYHGIWGWYTAIAFVWLYRLDDRFDLTALARSVGI